MYKNNKPTFFRICIYDCQIASCLVPKACNVKKLVRTDRQIQTYSKAGSYKRYGILKPETDMNS